MIEGHCRNSIFRAINKKALNKKIVTDSRKVIDGCVFVALKGHKTNGHLYLKEAINKGASVLVVENKKALHTIKDIKFKGLVYVTPDTRKTLSLLLNKFYNFPSQKMFCVGVTGTNGKTTVSHIVAFLLSALGWKVGLIGTIHNRLIQPHLFNKDSDVLSAEKINNKTTKQLTNNVIIKSSNTLTTPSATELYALLNYFYQQSAQAIVMEVSSIGLDQQRTGGVDFNLGVFTNLTQDHLDYHKNMSNYFQAKQKLFINMKQNKIGQNKTDHFLSVCNFDDSYGVALTRKINTPYISYGESSSQFQWKILSSDLSGSAFELLVKGRKIKIFTPLMGKYNVSNIVAAICCVHSAGFAMDDIVAILPFFTGVKGRMEALTPLSPHTLPYNEHSASPSKAQKTTNNKVKKPKVFIDYAHTPGALQVALKFLKQHKNKGQLFCVFGCGGERDKDKRTKMAQVAQLLSDKVILTSDNPRHENPLSIINDSLKEVKDKSKFIIEPDRKKAIQFALKLAQPKDIILIAGKGHETYQIIGDKKYPFDDKKIATLC